MSQKTQNKFIIVDHSSSVRLRLVGETLKDLFAQALEGTASFLYRDYFSRGVLPTTIPIKISSIDVNSLLVDFLSEVVYQSELHQSVFSEIKIKRFTNSELEGDISGKHIAKFDKKIKTVTYDAIQIMRNTDSLWQTDVVFDV